MEMVTIIITLPFLLFLIHLIYKRCSRSIDHPPGSTGWLIFGENVQFGMLGALKFIEERMKRHSKHVFKTSLLGEKMAVLCGAKGNKFFFANEINLFTTWIPKSAKRSLFFPEFVDEPSENLSAILLTSVPNFLKPEALKQIIPIMDNIALKQVEKEWAPHSEVPVFPLTKMYTFELGCRHMQDLLYQKGLGCERYSEDKELGCRHMQDLLYNRQSRYSEDNLGCRLFMSMEDHDQIKKLLDHFQVVVNGISSIPLYLPGTSYYKAVKQGTMLRDELLKVIKNKRESLMDNNHGKTCKEDLLSRLILMTDEDGNYTSDKIVCNNLVIILLASYETASTCITFVLKYLAEYPNIYKLVFQEQMEIAKTKRTNEFLTWEDTEKMKHTWNVIRETIRLMPPAIGGFRESKTEFTYAGFTIPKGWKVFWTVYSTHTNPENFPNPEKFDPSRFEGSGPAPYTFTPFGGGCHMCPGKEYARLEILAFIHNIVRKFKLEKALPHEKVVFHAVPHPEKGLLIRLQPYDDGSLVQEEENLMSFIE